MLIVQEIINLGEKLNKEVLFENNTFKIVMPGTENKVPLSELSLAACEKEVPNDKSEAYRLGSFILADLLPELKDLYQNSGGKAEFSPQLVSFISSEFKSTFTAVNSMAITNMLFSHEVEKVFEILNSWFEKTDCEISCVKVSGAEDENTKGIFAFRLD